MIMLNLGKKEKIELTVTIILVFFFVVLLFAFSSRLKSKNQPPKRILPGMFSAGEYFRYDTQRNKGMPFILDKTSGEITEIKRDPFSFGSWAGNQGNSASELFLKGIIWNIDKPSAVINDRVLFVGEVISGYKVTKISEDGVILENDNSKLSLKLNQ